MRVEYAPLFVNMMTPFPESAKPMMDDLLRGARSRQPVDLSDAAAETVCRFLLDMPDIGAWRRNANEILPLYRTAARRLLLQDLRSDDGERRDRASYWLDDTRSPLRDSAPGRDSSFPSRPSPKATGDSSRVLRPEPSYTPPTSATTPAPTGAPVAESYTGRGRECWNVPDRRFRKMANMFSAIYRTGSCNSITTRKRGTPAWRLAKAARKESF